MSTLHANPLIGEAQEQHLMELGPEDRRIYQAIPEEIDYVKHPSFTSARTEDRLFGPGAEEVEMPAWTFFPEVPEDLPVTRQARPRLTGQQEQHLFLRYNYARCRIGRLQAEQRRRWSTPRAKEMVVWYRRALKAQETLVQANLALVLAMARRARVASSDFADLISEGNMALLRSVEKFDVSRGFKFSTYACRAILKSFSHIGAKLGRYRQHFPAEFDPEMEQSDYDVKKHEIQRAELLETLQETLVRNLAHLTEVERTIVTERFPIGSGVKGKTLTEVGKVVGLTNERVRQIQNLALTKLRVSLEAEKVAA